MYPGERFRDRPRLVGLDAADEVPGERAASQRRDLRQRLLQVALTEIGDTAVGRGGEQLRRLRLADRKECDRLRTTAGGGRGPRHAFAHLVQHRGQILRIH